MRSFGFNRLSLDKRMERTRELSICYDTMLCGGCCILRRLFSCCIPDRPCTNATCQVRKQHSVGAAVCRLCHGRSFFVGYSHRHLARLQHYCNATCVLYHLYSMGRKYPTDANRRKTSLAIHHHIFAFACVLPDGNSMGVREIDDDTKLNPSNRCFSKINLKQFLYETAFYKYKE